MLVFLRRILDEARSKRHDMVTHYTVDDLRVALGFAKPASGEEIRPRRVRARAPMARTRAERGRALGSANRPTPETPDALAPQGDSRLHLESGMTSGAVVTDAPPYLGDLDASLPWSRAPVARRLPLARALPPGRPRGAGLRPQGGSRTTRASRSPRPCG